MITQVYAHVAIDAGEFANSLTPKEARDMVFYIDEAQQDLDFTKELVKMLVSQIKTEYTDYTDELDPEFKRFIKSLKKV